MRWQLGVLAGGIAVSLITGAARAEDKYGPGVTDTEIKLGQTVAYSGPGSAYSIFGRIAVGYWAMVNAQGGINGRKVSLISLDDGYSPPKTVEATRKLIEGEKVLATIGSMCTPCQIAVEKYMNQRGVPQLYMAASSPLLHDPKTARWTIAFAFAYDIEGEILGKYVRDTQPNAKIAVLFQNDDVGKSYLRGFKRGLGEGATDIVKEISYEPTDPTIDSQVLTLQSTNASVFADFSQNKFAAQAIRKVASSDWKPLHIIPYIASSISGVLTPAGLDQSKGLVSMVWFKNPSDPAWARDADMVDYLAFMKKYLPSDDPGDTSAIYSYIDAQLSERVLKAAGNDLTRENLMKQATSVTNLSLPMMLPGMTINITPDNYYPIRQGQLARFDGTRWVVFSGLVSAESRQQQP